METPTMISEWVFCVTAFLILHSYFLYPLIASLVGKDRELKDLDEFIPISFLVPAHNEASVIAAKIQNFNELDYPPELTELLIADDGSTDGTAKYIEPYLSDRVRLLSSSERCGKASSMNKLVAAAKHPYLLLSDANVLLAPSVVKILASQFRDQSVGAATGEVCLIGSNREFRAGESLYYWMERRIQSAESRLGSVMGVDGGMYMLARSHYQKLPVDTILDDFLVSMNVLRSRSRIVYASSAKAVESGTPSARQEFARRVRIAAGAVQLLRRWNVPLWTQPVYWIQFVSHKLLRWISPLLFGIMFCSNCFLLSRSSWYWLPFIAQVVALFVMLLTWQNLAFRRTSFGAIAFYFGLSQVAMLIGLLKGVANQQKSQWEKSQRSVGDLRSLG